jgi:hypothetical protein
MDGQMLQRFEVSRFIHLVELVIFVKYSTNLLQPECPPHPPLSSRIARFTSKISRRFQWEDSAGLGLFRSDYY